MPELDAERRERLAEAIQREYGCKPGMIHEGYGAECDSSAHAPALYRTFGCDHVSEVTDALAPLVAGWLADAWDAGWHQAEESWGHEEPTAGNPYRGGDDG